MDTIEKKISLKKRFLAFFASLAVLAGGVVAGVQANQSDPSTWGTVTVKSDQPGAELQILDANGNVVKHFTMEGKEQTFTDIPAGEGYKLHEVTPPEGYKLTGDWTFSVVPTHTEGTTVLSPAQQLPTSVSANNDGLPTTGAYHTNDGMFVFCVDASDEFPPRGNYSAQDFNGFNGLSRDQLLRILYVGFVGNAKNYGSQFVDAEDYDAGTQFWMATQYAVTSYTNPSLAEEYFGKYLGPNKRLANQIKAAANDTSIVVPDGSIAYLYQSPGNQPFAAASFPVVQQTQVNGEPTEISITHTQSTTPPDTPPDTPGVENGKLVVKKTDENGNVLKGAKFQIKDQAGNVIQEFTSNGQDEFTLAPGTYVLQETQAPEGYEIQGTGKYTFTIKPGTTGVVAPGDTATVVASGTTGGSLFVGTGHMEIGDGLAFCVNPQAVFLWEGNGGNTYSYSVLGESKVDFDAFGTKNPAGARGWMNAAPGNVGLSAAKMDQVKKVLWATYDYAKTGDARKDYTRIIVDNIGTPNDKFKQAAVYQATQVAIAEIVSPGSVNWNAIGDNNTSGNVKTLAQALVAAAQGQSAYFAAYSGYSIVYLQSDDPSTQNLVTPGSEAVELTIKNNKKYEQPETPKGKLIVKKVDGAGNFLKDAKFQIEDADGNVITTFTSNGKAQEFWLEPGTYVVREIEAPNGYQIKGDGKYTVTITADQLPMTQYVRLWNGGGDSGELNGGYKVAPSGTGENWYPVYCLNVGMPNLNAGGANNSELPASVGNITHDQMLRILYVGQLGDARGYSKQIEAGNGLDKDTQWWMTTQYAINFYTNGQTSAYNKHGHYLTSNNMAIANELIAAANDASIAIPEGTVARLYQHSPKDGREQQPMVSASFPKTVEISVVNEKAPEKPKIGTTATDGTTGDHIGLAAEKTVLKDVVKYENLEPGKKYTVKGQLMKRADSSVIEGATAEATFWASKTGTGTVELTFTYDARALAGFASVAFEELYDVNGKLVAEHKDIKDEGQTVYYPEAKTTATEGGDHYAVPSGKVTIVDEVKYTNLIPGKQYTVTGTLHDKATGEALTVEGATATKTFTAEAKKGSVKLEFTIDASALKGKAVVAFETVKYEGNTVAVHADINDEEQTVYFPEIGTTATSNGYKQVKADGTVTIKDVVKYEGLKPGTEYSLSGKLVTKSSGGKDVVATNSTTFTASETGKGEVVLEFTVDASTLAGDSVVAFETVSYNGKEVAVHADINDADQTVTFPEVKTNATDKEDGDQVLAPEKTVTVVDKVTYKNLLVGKTYTVSGVLMDKATGQPLLVDGKQVTAEKTFKATKANGSINLEFTFDASALEGKTLVVFESLKHQNREVAVHADINDVDQTTKISEKPEIGTTLADGKGNKEVEMAKNVKLVDTVAYSNLKGGKTYTLKGKLVKKSDEKSVIATGEATFTADASGNGEAKMTFTIDTTKLGGSAVVAYEYLFIGDVTGKDVKESDDEFVTKHEDINDGNQTVYVREKPEIEKYVNQNVHKEIDLSEVFTYDVLAYVTKDADKVVITDTLVNELQFVSAVADVKVVDLGTENDHTPYGTVAKPGTPVANAQVAINGQTLTVTIDPANAERGHWVKVTFDAKIKDGLTLDDLKYEKVEKNDPVLTDEKHEGVPNDAEYKIQVGNDYKYKDESNTVTVKPAEIGTIASVKGTEGDKVTFNDTEVTVIDAVLYKGLEPGKEYTLKGKLVKKSDGSTVVEGEAKFTANASGTGIALMEFPAFDASKLGGDAVVAFEYLYRGDVTGKDVNEDSEEYVTKHEDINDEGQTVEVEKPEVKTNASDAADGDKYVNIADDVVINDVVTFTNLIPGKEYTLDGELHVKDAEQTPVEAKSIKAVAAEGATIKDADARTFVADKANGSVTLAFTVDGTKVAGEQVVVFESLKYLGKEIAVHADINDLEQTVYFPQVGTTATIGGEKQVTLIYKNEAITVTDEIAYSGFAAGETYTVKGKLVSKADNGKTVVVENAGTFTTSETGEGTWKLDFTFNTGDLAREHRQLVVFEYVYAGETEIASHADIEDEGQTVELLNQRGNPEIGTTATDANDGDKVLEAGSDATVKDVVEYHNLASGEIYTLKGKLVVKGTDGKTVVAEVEKSFVATDSNTELVNGTVDMLFDFNTTGLEGKELVVYEYLYRGDVVGKDVNEQSEEYRTKHADDNDKGQTVTVKQENKTPPPTPPTKKTRVKLPVTGLPTTGESVALAGVVALMLLGGGLVLVRRRNS